MITDDEKKIDEELINIIQQERIKVARKKIKEYFKDVIHPFFPNCKLRSASPQFIEDIFVMFGTILNLEPINSHLYNSEYSYQKNLNFIHYTSSSNCLSIIREQSFRMYNLHSMDDKFELRYATEGGAFKYVTDEQIQCWKENVFSLSMCETEVEDGEKSFELWKTYGNNGKGVGIIFSFDNTNQQTWKHSYLSKIHYSTELINRILEAHVRFHKKHENYCILGDYEELLVNLCCFHKPPIYSYEREIRFLEFNNSIKRDKNYLDFYKALTGVENQFFIFRKDFNAWEKNDQKISPVISANTEIDFSSYSKPIRFKRLPITEKFRSHLLEVVNCPYVINKKELFFPKVKIDKIILGYNFTENDAQNFRNVINELADQYLGYEVYCELTKLKKYFNTNA